VRFLLDGYPREVLTNAAAGRIGERERERERRSRRVF